MIKIDQELSQEALAPLIGEFWKLSGKKIISLGQSSRPGDPSPVFTRKGVYQTRGWTDWTQGFAVGSALLQYEATQDKAFLELGRRGTREKMPPHLTHTGVHDHGFNNISTYGNLLRLMKSGLMEQNDEECAHYQLALKVSGAVQACRWTTLGDSGYIYSFNGPHSLFADTIRSLRSLVAAHLLGHVLYGENDKEISLLERTRNHIETTARFIVYYGEGRDYYDIPGRVAHEALFNLNDGNFRAPNSQQGYSPFSTWTRGLAWIMLGSAEQLEYFNFLGPDYFQTVEVLKKMALATAEFYLAHMPADGVPYWDTGAPGLIHLGDYGGVPADPFNNFEPVDSSAGAIAAQGLLRLGDFLGEKAGGRFFQAGLTLLKTLLGEPYLSTEDSHQGLLLHSVYHRPGGWDYVPPGRKIPCGESSMWGDYHIREVVLYLQKRMEKKPLPRFFDI